MLIILPLAAFGLVFVYFWGSERQTRKRSWHAGFLLASAYWALLLGISAEVLSLVKGITRWPLAALWFILLLGAGALVKRSGAATWARQQMRHGWSSLDGWDQAGLAGLALICAALLVIALKAPPNNVDSFIYHMTRVMHWAQNGSLNHYPATVNHQLFKPTWAETAILYLRVLWGGDRVANLVQWFSMVGSLVAAAGIANLLGGSRKAQLLSAAFTISIPMGILQATSTQNDYVAAYWAISLAYLVVLASKRALDGLELGALVSVVGIGVLTKGTFFVYFPVFIAWYFLTLMRNHRWKAILGHGVLLAAAVFAINFGFWARDVTTFGGPYGSMDWLNRNLWFDIHDLSLPEAGESRIIPSDRFPPPLYASEGLVHSTGDSARGFPTVNINWAGGVNGQPAVAHASATSSFKQASGPLGTLANLAKRELQMMGRNLTAPVGFVQRLFLKTLALFPGTFDQGYLDDLRGAAWNHEDFAGNPIHLFLVPVTLGLLGLYRPAQTNRRTWGYAAAALLSYALAPVVISHVTSKWGIRYQLPFFVLWGPAAGIGIAKLGTRGTYRMAAAVFLLISLPWVLLNNTRPVIGLPPWPTSIDSIFVSTDSEILLATNPGLEDDFRLVTEAVEDTQCTQVGLRLETGDLEYPLWWLLDAPQSGIEMRVLNGGPPSTRGILEGFHPCAVICTICEGRPELDNMPLLGRFDSFDLYSSVQR